MRWVKKEESVAEPEKKSPGERNGRGGCCGSWELRAVESRRPRFWGTQVATLAPRFPVP